MKMKRKVAAALTLVFSLSLFTAFAAQQPNKVKDYEDKIHFSKEGTTRIATPTVIVMQGELHGNELTISVLNYTGTVRVEILTSRGGIHYSFDVEEMGYGLVDVSSLRAGTYNVRLIIDNFDSYIGTITKPLRGR